MDLLDTAVNSGTELLLENLRSLSAERLIECVEAHLVESDLLREQADRFICALNAGQILPEDF
ncbi:hypothetical protein [Miltoncostaea oceani]|uniref:hypothetical protein n=1 Tax=Miltoncostaea oceani TaxID=2843216 RepID=UPI001C3DD1EB|nr:hypothetical protein [Miltoncostaea oceani]